MHVFSFVKVTQPIHLREPSIAIVSGLRLHVRDKVERTSTEMSNE